ncbi:Ca(2+)-dependent cysteine protease [Rhizophlyctis rosea]|nr:Ca(2+)-dependent cysteine protease [Rhizophlyctis rosea]
MFGKFADIMKDKVGDLVEQQVKQQFGGGGGQQGQQGQPQGGYGGGGYPQQQQGGGYGGQQVHDVNQISQAYGHSAYHHVQQQGGQIQQAPIQVPQGTPAAQQWGTATSGGKRKALLIGINYTGSSAALKGCINDVHNVHQWLTANYPFAPQEVLILTDDQQDPSRIPTRANILNAFKWLVNGAQSGDAFFLHYSGHGSQEKDAHGDENDGVDETIVPVDYQQAGQIHDDDINSILVHPLPQGARLTAIFDCCHSGSVMDLPFTYTVDGNLDVVVRDNTQEMIKHGLKAGMAIFQKDNATALREAKELFSIYMQSRQQGNNSSPVDDEARKKIMEAKGSRGLVVQFSGCMDNQTSADANIANQATGAMSWALLTALNNNNHHMSYTDVLRETRKLLEGKYKQIPQMSTASHIDHDDKTVFWARQQSDTVEQGKPHGPLHGIGKRIRSLIDREDSKLHYHRFRRSHHRHPSKDHHHEPVPVRAEDKARESESDSDVSPQEEIVEQREFVPLNDSFAAAAEPGGVGVPAGQAPNAPIQPRKRRARQLVDGGTVMSNAQDLELEKIHNFDGDREQIDRFPTSRSVFPLLKAIDTLNDPVINLSITRHTSIETTPSQAEIRRILMRELVVFHNMSQARNMRTFAPDHPIKMYVPQQVAVVGQKRLGDIAEEEEGDDGEVTRQDLSEEVGNAPATMHPTNRRKSYFHRDRRVIFPEDSTDPTSAFPERQRAISQPSLSVLSLLPTPSAHPTSQQTLSLHKTHPRLPHNFTLWKRLYHSGAGEGEISAPTSVATSVSFAPWISHDPDAADMHEHVFWGNEDDEAFVIRSMIETKVDVGGGKLHVGAGDVTAAATSAIKGLGSTLKTTAPEAIHKVAETVESMSKTVTKIVGDALHGIVKGVSRTDDHTVSLDEGDVRTAPARDGDVAQIAA